jgi:hypothetical protein
VTIEILCCAGDLAFHGEWAAGDAPESLVRRLRAEATRRGIPIQVSVRGRGTWSIAPNGRVIRGALFRRERLAGKKSGAPLDRSAGGP